MRRVAGVVALLLAVPTTAAPPSHDRAFWTGLAAKEFAVPEGETAGGLALEAADLLSSPDPALRDGIAFEALARWIYRDGLVAAPDLELLRRKLQDGLKAGLRPTAGRSRPSGSRSSPPPT
mgnify:CR=1 FL=1